MPVGSHLREVTTKYDGRGRPVARTTWLVARGTVDISDPPIAGLGSIAATDGLTEQFLYDDNLADGEGLDNTSGLDLLIGSGSVSLSEAITKLAGTQANGGAGLTFDANAAGSARVSISATGEVSFSIADAAGRSVMSGMLQPPSDTNAGDLITWSCTKHDGTTNLSGYGTVLETASINALGKTRKSRTDAAGRTLESIDELGKITSYTFDASGNQLSVTDPNGAGQSCLYDALGRDVSCTDTAGDETQSVYDLAGNKIAAIDAKEETSTYAFDARGRQVSQTDRLAGVTEFAYTPTGQLASLTDAEEQATSYTYDDVGNKLVETYPDHVANSTIGQSTYGQIQFVYDAIGRTVVRTDQQGDTCEYAYDLAGRLLSKDYAGHASGPLTGVSDSDTFTYDAASRMLTAVSGRYSNSVTYTYDTAGRKSTEGLTISGQTYTVSTAYDAAGQVSGYTYPDGKVVGRTYSDRGQLATLVYDSTTIDTRVYDDGGRMTSSSYNNGVSESRTYNNDNTLAGISFTGAAIGNLTYGWDENKNKTSESIGGTMSGYGFDVGGSGYDSEDRLVNWERADTALDQAWNLSLVGDWTSITENTTTQNRTHGPTHELASVASQSVTHDAKGNMTLIPAVLRGSSQTPTQPLKMKWDFENKLLAADIDNDNTDDVFYKFDALGRRVARTASSATTVYFQSGQQTIADYSAGTANSSPTYNYVYASYIDEPVMRSTGSSGAKHYFHRNQQYSINAITDGSAAIVERYAYSAYGTPTITDASGITRTTTAIGNRYTYTGREYDEALALYHYRARMYDSVGGRFVSRDPIGYRDGVSLYQYTLGDPLKYIDPSGLICQAQNHHWFPVKHGQAIESRCSSIGFKIDYFTTPLNRCWDEDEHCDAHGWLHGNKTPGRNRRSPDWNAEVKQILDSTSTCCSFLVAMASAIAAGYAELADEFEDCDQPPCYRMRTFRTPRGPDALPPPDTTLLFADIVSACRRGTNPEPLPLPHVVYNDGDGLQRTYPETIFIPIKIFPRIYPRVKPPIKIPAEPPLQIPAAPPIEIPRRIAA